MRRSGGRGMMWTRVDWLAALAAGIGLAVGIAGCDSSTGLNGDRGRMTVLLTDAPFPFDLVAEANVTISRVEVVGDAGVQVVAEGEQQLNLLDLQNGVTATLGSAVLPEGGVSQIRLIVTDASVVLTDGATFDLTVPSGAQTGIKILTPNAEIEAGAETTATLDMDVSESFIVQGSVETVAGIDGFLFTPVVKLVAMETTSEETASEETTTGS
ncbi:MAG: DUF4382 domain-containing protein [Gemmatimonadota bacterium]